MGHPLAAVHSFSAVDVAGDLQAQPIATHVNRTDTILCRVDLDVIDPVQLVLAHGRTREPG